MAIVSMGGLGTLVAYDFDQPFTVLSKGHGRWGDGWYTLSDGDLLAGHELHCVIQFTGNISSINWTNYPNENWHGITIGAPATATSPVPEPSPRLLLCFGLFGLVGVKKKFS
ncbi:MAG: PEP-CTERM sorting domain-containing protein [bacterium]